MIPKKILQKVRHIEIKTKGLVNSLFSGEYHSAFKGRGMTFSEVREYSQGDDIRMIDWNVTARSNAPFVKIFEEERELTVYLLVDISKSGDFSTSDQFKSELAAEIAAVLGFSAIKNQDNVGLILFSSKVEKYLAPKKNKSHILRLIREVLFYKSTNNGTSLKSALDFLMKVAKRRSIVFLISDFIDNNYWQSLKFVNKKHDLIGIKIEDPAELLLPNLGLIKVYDLETDQRIWVDLSAEKYRKKLHTELKGKSIEFDIKCKNLNFSIIKIKSNKDYVEPIMSYFHKR